MSVRAGPTGDFLRFYGRPRSHGGHNVGDASAAPGFSFEEIPFGGTPIRADDGTVIDFTPISRPVASGRITTEEE